MKTSRDINTLSINFLFGNQRDRRDFDEIFSSVLFLFITLAHEDAH